MNNGQNQCVLTPQQIEGPFYVPYHISRKDIRENHTGFRLELKLTVYDSSGQPLPNATVDIWQCDEFGYYSGFTSWNPNEIPPQDDNPVQTDQTTFLRGEQITDDNGVVEFVTIFPGWYYGRPVHIHVKVFHSGNRVHTGQFYFSDELCEKVSRVKPYSERQFKRARNEDDRYFVGQEGYKTILVPQQIDPNNFEAGLSAEMSLFVKS